MTLHDRLDHLCCLVMLTHWGYPEKQCVHGRKYCTQGSCLKCVILHLGIVACEW